MTINLKEGLQHISEFQVTYDDTAIKFESGNLKVLATPALIAFMENTAFNSVLSLLPEGYNTVGTEVNIKHLRATPVGVKVRCKAVLKNIDGSNLLFDVFAWDNIGEIGKGTHKRYIIETERFMKNIN